MFTQSPFFYGTFATGPAPLVSILWNTSYVYVPNNEAQENYSTEYVYKYSLDAVGVTGPTGP